MLNPTEGVWLHCTGHHTATVLPPRQCNCTGPHTCSVARNATSITSSSPSASVTPSLASSTRQSEGSSCCCTTCGSHSSSGRGCLKLKSPRDLRTSNVGCSHMRQQEAGRLGEWCKAGAARVCGTAAMQAQQCSTTAAFSPVAQSLGEQLSLQTLLSHLQTATAQPS